MILKPNWLEPEIDQNVILKFSLIISLVYNKDTDIEAPVPASVYHHCLVLSCLVPKLGGERRSVASCGTLTSTSLVRLRFVRLLQMHVTRFILRKIEAGRVGRLTTYIINQRYAPEYLSAPSLLHSKTYKSTQLTHNEIAQLLYRINDVKSK